MIILWKLVYLKVKIKLFFYKLIQWLVPKTEEKLVLGILGAGVQARSHYEALKVIYDFSEVSISYNNVSM